MRRTLVIALVMLVSSVLCSPFAHADTLQFTGSSLSGSGTFTFPMGNDQHLDVANALVGNLLASSGLCTTKCTVTGGYVNLDSGGQTSNSGGVYNFDAGGQLEIFGEIDALGITTVTELLQANFLAGQTLQFSGSTGTFRGLLDPSTIALNPSVSSQPPVSGTDTESEFKVSFNSSTGTYSGAISQSTITVTTDPPAPSPEPSSILLLGSGLLSFRKIYRRRFN